VYIMHKTVNANLAIQATLSDDIETLGLGKDDLLAMYNFMVLTREFENSILTLYRQGKIVGGAYTGYGNEATSVGTAYALEKHDYLFPMHRDIGAHFAKGQNPKQLYLQHLARRNSLTRGRDGTGHYADPALRIYGNISHLGAMIPVACGVSLASKMRHENAVVLTYIGDGGSNTGDFHEALAMASVMKLPLVLIIENNQYAYSTPISKQYSCEKLSNRSIGYNIPGVTIDGTDIITVYRETKKAIERARIGKGPSLIESVTMRLHGHSAHDDAAYVPKELYEAWQNRDPINQFAQKLTFLTILTNERDRTMRRAISDILSKAAEEALSDPYPDGPEVAQGVFAGDEP
jgi:TPP-dependent pyruvate/acetoin dehydrogenase alpha subunit